MLEQISPSQSDFSFFLIQPWSHQIPCFGQYDLLSWKQLQYHKFILPVISKRKSNDANILPSVVPLIQQSLAGKHHQFADGENWSWELSGLGLKLLNFRLWQECRALSDSHPQQQLRGQTLGLHASFWMRVENRLLSQCLYFTNCSQLWEYWMGPSLIKCINKSLWRLPQ